MVAHSRKFCNPKGWVVGVGNAASESGLMQLLKAEAVAYGFGKTSSQKSQPRNQQGGQDGMIVTNPGESQKAQNGGATNAMQNSKPGLYSPVPLPQGELPFLRTVCSNEEANCFKSLESFLLVIFQCNAKWCMPLYWTRSSMETATSIYMCIIYLKAGSI